MQQTPTVGEASREGALLRWVWAVIRLGRPRFLIGGFAMFGLGAAMAHATGASVSGRRYLAGHCVVTSVQLMTHYANDYFDYAADVANRSPTRWSGGSRVLPSGQLPRSTALHAALIAAGLATVSALVVHSLGAGATVWSLMVAILVLSWSYSGPPLRLNAKGWGEAVAAVVVAGLVPQLAYAGQVGGLSMRTWLAVTPLVLIVFGMLLVLDIPDREGDLAVAKRTLSVRLGIDGTAALHNAVLACAYGLLPVLLVLGIQRRVVLSLAFTSPLALLQVVAVARGKLHEAQHWERLALRAVLLVLVATVAEVAGFMWVTP